MSLVHNEQTKLTATYLNSLAIAIWAVGGFAPLVAALSSDLPPSRPMTLLALVSVCFAASGALHSLARRLLRDLMP